ncbi:hypothetical protein HYT57_04785 [Candidatus Woesearchaeota archaeon]|nr:hypothetical protein [Candidatus Woesearchaeota archaeon]
MVKIIDKEEENKEKIKEVCRDELLGIIKRELPNHGYKSDNSFGSIRIRVYEFGKSVFHSSKEVIYFDLNNIIPGIIVKDKSLEKISMKIAGEYEEILKNKGNFYGEVRVEFDYKIFS